MLSLHWCHFDPCDMLLAANSLTRCDKLRAVCAQYTRTVNASKIRNLPFDLLIRQGSAQYHQLQHRNIHHKTRSFFLLLLTNLPQFSSKIISLLTLFLKYLVLWIIGYTGLISDEFLWHMRQQCRWKEAYYLWKLRHGMVFFWRWKRWWSRNRRTSKSIETAWKVAVFWLRAHFLPWLSKSTQGGLVLLWVHVCQSS